MFTGLVSDIGTVERIAPQKGGVRLTLRPRALPADELALGESVAVSGVCLTVVERGGGAVSFDAIPETLARSTLGGLREGSLVNLERALALGDRLGGHLVLGHVDAVGEVLAVEPEGQGARVTVALPASIAPLVAEKGSVAVDGISLTVAAIRRAAGQADEPAPERAGGSGGRLRPPEMIELALIPETLARTTMGQAKAGTKVNLEADVLARHVARLAEFTGGEGPLAERLKAWGYGS